MWENVQAKRCWCNCLGQVSRKGKAMHWDNAIEHQAFNTKPRTPDGELERKGPNSTIPPLRAHLTLQFGEDKTQPHTGSLSQAFCICQSAWESSSIFSHWCCRLEKIRNSMKGSHRFLSKPQHKENKILPLPKALGMCQANQGEGYCLFFPHLFWGLA